MVIMSFLRAWPYGPCQCAVSKNSFLLVSRARTGRRVISAIPLDDSTLGIHVPRSSPISERVIRPGLIPSFRHYIKKAVDTEKLFAAAAVGRVSVEDLP